MIFMLIGFLMLFYIEMGWKMFKHPYEECSHLHNYDVNQFIIPEI